MLRDLKRRVSAANGDLVKTGLVTLTWGNVSGIDREKGLVVIKPSGVPYDELEPECMVVVDLEGCVVEGELKPSSDTPTHLVLYRAMETIGGVVHTHSCHATMFAQARWEIPCLGTTHADHFHGSVPVTRSLSEAEVAEDYEGHTGHVIVERFRDLDPEAMPAVLVAGHAPFTWGKTAEKALENSVALEAVAEMALGTWSIDRAAAELEPWVLDKHYRRKHGPAAYYGQK
ncbi:MAG: L-ribulose-5-phosphate 4-epimerase AraD [Thermoguttaceae bacterium]